MSSGVAGSIGAALFLLVLLSALAQGPARLGSGFLNASFAVVLWIVLAVAIGRWAVPVFLGLLVVFGRKR